MEKKIESLISQMTLDEKIGQLTQEFVTNERMDELAKLAENGELGSCILAFNALAGDDEQEELFISKLNEIQRSAVEKSRMGIPVINGRDVIHGSRTIFPIPLAQAATWDYNLIRDAAEIMAKEARFEGVHWTFAPMLDVCTDPRWGRIIECPGEDPYIGKMFARASVDGIQGEGRYEPDRLAACAKHFIGYGAPLGGRDKNPTEWSDYSLRNRALPAFCEAVDAGVATVMSSFNEISGQPATSSRYHLTDILRGELGFDGFVISDWDAVVRLKVQGVSDSDETSAVLALNAGVDMDMVDCVYKNNLRSAYEKGLVTMDTIDEAVRRVLRIKMRMGLFDNPYIYEGDFTDKIMTPSYLEKAKEVTNHSMVLLKNDGVLPISKGVKVSLKGYFAKEKKNLLGSWHAGGSADDVISLEEGMISINGAENISDDAEVSVIAIGESWHMTGEGKTLSNIDIPDSQVELAKREKDAGKKVVVVIFSGRPFAITKLLPYCDAVLWGWHGGTMTGLSAAEIIFGEFNPCGKLTVTFPRSTGQIPIHYNHNRNEYLISGYYNKQKYLSCNENSTPLFEFGYGLSYTSYEYSNFDLKLSDYAEITFDIKNTGEFDGWEIPQCYICDLVASVGRPVKELKAFDKVFIKKGETKKVKFTLKKEDLSFYNTRGEFIFEPGEFRLEVGRSCKDICFETVEYINF